MSALPPLPSARWWCAEIGAVTPERLGSDERRTWTYDDFRDQHVSRDGVTLWVAGRTWTVTNHSTSMHNAYLYDVVTGRRLLAPARPCRWLCEHPGCCCRARGETGSRM